MKYVVRVRKILTGSVAIDADCSSDALNKAFERFELQGEELPDMDDESPLSFSIDGQFSDYGKEKEGNQ